MSFVPRPRLRAVDRSHKCAVCGHQSDGAHFAAECCRACAAFFRRSIALEVQYTCRGKEDCPVNTTVRCICRACRLNKCFQVGMKKELVQSLKRSEKGGDSDLKTPRSCKDLPAPQLLLTSLPVSSSATDDQLAPLLCRIRNGYRGLREMRSDYRDSYPEEERVPRALTVPHAIDVMIRDYPNVQRFVHASFPLDGINQQQRIVLCRDFYIQMWFLESAFRTVEKNCKDKEEGFPRFYVVDGDYNDNTDEFYKSCKRYKISSEGMQTFNDSSLSIVRRSLLYPMLGVKLEELELCALFVFCLFVKRDDKFEETTERVAKQMKNKVVRELLALYARRMNLAESCARLAHTLSIVELLQKATTWFYHDVFNGLMSDEDRFDHLQRLFQV